ncbi:MAG: hypothetical protein U1F46_09830 [Marinagarivorans sp.]
MTNLKELADGHWQLIGIRLNLSPLLAEKLLVRFSRRHKGHYSTCLASPHHTLLNKKAWDKQFRIKRIF